MIIGGIDRAETIKLQNKDFKKLQSFSSDPSMSAIEKNDDGLTRRMLNRDSAEIRDNAIIAPSTSQKNYNQLSLPTVATVCDRFGLSSRSAAAITSAVLVDVGIVTETDRRLIIDKNKIRRAISKSRKEMLVDLN